MLNYSLIIRESPCGRWVTLTPAANWPINNPAGFSWRGSRSQRRNLLSASTFCLDASTACRRIRTRRHTCSAVSAGETPDSCYCCLKLQLLECVVCPSVPMADVITSVDPFLLLQKDEASCFTLFSFVFVRLCAGLKPVWMQAKAAAKILPNISSGYTHNFIKMGLRDWNCSLIRNTAITGNIQGNNFDSHFS